MNTLRFAAATAALLASVALPALAQAQAQAPTAPTASAPARAAAPTVVKSVKVEPGGLYQIVFNPADSTVLVAAVGPRGETRGAVARLNADLTPGAAIDVSANPLYGLGFNSRTQILYGTATRSGSVDAVDVRTGQVVAHITDGDDDSAHVREAVVDERRNKVYVTIVGGEAGDASRPNQVWVIDGATNTLERKIDVPVGGLTGAALDVENNRLFVTGMSSGDIAAIDLATGEATGRWPTGSERPTNVAFDARGGRLFVASQGSGDLTVMNAADGAIIKKTPTGEGALSVAYNPGVDQIYVANRQAGTVTVVGGADYAVLANLQTGTFPQTIAIDPATNAVYVTNKARGLPRNAPAGTPAPVDPAGDTVTLIRP
ncbi:PQQ-binding-like beta-propeller repeat protein [Brevundimonas albigilva]|uniref:PQQ-binding-like beta-propeller repeat protein n=1 Tax=Brevundimonas albigilva TaxID=1312364 RepID=A0ABY4SQ97_9CAUL|nr:YncE family protein [Brevundimonas albigilva]UQV18912.1 PQQ-binding-like beta-propeller repeat protein [Brevundimonas albigilva]URI16305.1 PQQ-binding-like beta-propeller repeat protein [Brevundimonas albigilva]